MESSDTAYTPEQAEEYDRRRFTDSSGRAIHAAERDHLLDALRRLPAGSRVLEVGCGTGRLLVETDAAGHQVDGLDASGPMLEQLRQKLGGASRGTLTVGDASDLPFDDDVYDLVYAIRLLNQLGRPEVARETIREMVRVARPGGFVLVEFVSSLRPRTPSSRPTVRLHPREVRTLLQEAGAAVLDTSASFLFGMTAFRLAPERLLPALAGLDRWLAARAPSVSGRVYVLARKR